MILLMITNVLYAFGYPLSKIGMNDTQPSFLLSVRMLIGGLIFLFYRLRIQKKKIVLSRALFWNMFLSGVLTYYLSNILSLKGLEMISATRASVIENFAPFMSAVLEFIVFKDQFSVIEWTGIAIVTFGTLPMCASAGGAVATLAAGGPVSGDFLIVASNLTDIFAWMCIRNAASQEDYDPFIANLIGMLTGGTLSLIHSLCVENWHPIPTTNMTTLVINTVLMMIIYNFLTDNLYNYLAGRHSVTAIMISGFTIPTFVAIFDRLMCGIAIPSNIWLSTGFVVLGMLCCSKTAVASSRSFLERFMHKKPSEMPGGS